MVGALLLNLGFFGEETPQERLDLTNPTLRVIYRVVRTQGFVFLSLSESLKALRIRPFLTRFLASNRPFLELNLGLIYLNLVLTIFTQTGFIFRLGCTTTNFYKFSIE